MFSLKSFKEEKKKNTKSGMKMALIKYKNYSEKLKKNNSKKTISKEFTLKQTNKKQLDKAGKAGC